ncbi:hypothetical protein EDB81DRAFT_906536 [Dactylonectria macrodidyma]|uniref:Protein kinase domain-containing protein n=1 Tax=Dactylonectria macrodidyma TaxID=307937 RepID=A0A9P9DZZ5_9HYPO|nr:hypothetical protein EDB81DRAFT_906536 [Dactylonectria macrodidyma]
MPTPMGDSTTARLNALESVSLRTTPPIPEYLELIDIDALAKHQFSIEGPVGSNNRVGAPSATGTLLLGAGGTFTVRRVPYESITHPIDAWDEPFDRTKRFVVVKQPGVDNKRGGGNWDKRLRDVMMELKILSHKPIRRHPNIVKLHSFMWDSQSNVSTALAPSLILEYADLGTLSDFQDIRRLAIYCTTKRHICVDIAEGLRFLNECGIVHGDVKSQNILLFRNEPYHQHWESTIRAKISDFGCSLIGMSDDIDCPKQQPWGSTELWAAPEPLPHDGCLDFLSLRRRDLYSYGLLVWQIICDGLEPWRLLTWDSNHDQIMIQPREEVGPPLQKVDISKLKQKEDTILGLAVTLIQGWSGVAEVCDKTRAVLGVTMRKDPSLRARSFDDILKIWGESKDARSERLLAPLPLTKGDFGISSPMFPKNIHLLKTTPPSFRHFVCDQLSMQAQWSASAAERANSAYAVAVCRLQGFYQEAQESLPNMAKGDSLKSAAAAVLQAAELGHVLARALVPSILEAAKLPTINWPSGEVLVEWLLNAVQQGSMRARLELSKGYPTAYHATVSEMRANRCRCADSLPVDEITPSNPSTFFNGFSLLDNIAKKILTQPGISRLHQAAYLGSFRGCQYLVEDCKVQIDLPNSQGCTPLHFAARNSQVEVCNYLIERGADINAQDDGGITALHMALLSLNTDDILGMLLDLGADPDRLAASQSGQSWLPDCYDYLIDPEGTPLHFAIKLQNLSAVQLLLQRGADPNKRSSSGITSFELCVQMRSSRLLELLLPYALKHDTNLPNPHNLYPCLVGFGLSQMTTTLYWQEGPHVAFLIPLVDRIREGGISLDNKGILHWAFDADRHEIVDYYLQRFRQKGENLAGPYRFRMIDYKSDESMVRDILLGDSMTTGFSNILGASSKAMALVVLKYAPKPLHPSGNYGLPWLMAIGARRIEPREDTQDLVSALIEAGADMSTTDDRGNGPLYSAAFWNNYNAVEALLSYNPSVDDIQRAIQVCLSKGIPRVASSILSAIFAKCPQALTVPLPKQDESAMYLNILDPNNTELNYLRSFCNANEFSRDETSNRASLLEALQMMQTQASNEQALRERLNEQSFFGPQTPLHCAARTGSVQLVEELLSKSGIDVNAMPVLHMPGFESPLTLSHEGEQDVISVFPDPMAAISSGLTPLDCAYDRNWELSLFQWPEKDRPLIEDLRKAGGTHREQNDFEWRTQAVIGLLRGAGGKTHEEIFGLPGTMTDLGLRNTAREESRMAFIEKNKPTEPSETSQQIQKLWGEVCGLPSSDKTHHRYPGLLSIADPARPRFSALSREAMILFDKCQTKGPSDIVSSSLHLELSQRRSRFEKWTGYNGVLSGHLDAMQDIPPTTASHTLAVGIFIGLYEVIQTLEYLHHTVREQVHRRDYQHRCQELLGDLDKAFDAFMTEKIRLKELSSAAVAEVETKLHVRLAELDMRGNLK